jgi:hypothetical protein
LFGETECYHGRLQSRESVSRTIFEQSASRIEIQSFTARPACSVLGVHIIMHMTVPNMGLIVSTSLLFKCINMWNYLPPHPPIFLFPIVCVSSIYIILVNGNGSEQAGPCILHSYCQVPRKWKPEYNTTIKLHVRDEGLLGPV